ncbi:N-acetylmuramoyl-L-alanine amidase [Thioalkalicoccus limnaeus]|uniref:N-acetylmuramoyl-L-alanine amidase n=1 Tax=Thioalkalicoccus limnaeus TaxID=120681 RepID=A0ABV4BGN4_9GAMM
MFKVIGLLLLFVSLPACSQQVEVESARVWTAPDHTRLIIDVAGPVSHQIRPLIDPDRLLIDIAGVTLPSKLPKVDAADPLIVRLRGGSPDGRNLRLVLDLKQPVRVKSTLAPPNERYGYRLVVDLQPKEADEAVRLAERAGDVRHARAGTTAGSGVAGLRELVVAIDAGHGGEDPGAIGPAGTREKDITLAIARRLEVLVEAAPGLRPVMIRDGDYFVRLRDRVQLARQHQADLFVSIHADAYHDPRVSGSSVYTLSFSGATSDAAKWLAERENKADLIGGVELTGVDSDLDRVLFELAQNGSLEHSRYAAEHVLTRLKGTGPVHRASVQQARFVVLKSPDIPSMLVETAFISNPDDERRLRDSAHQQRIAQAIFEGVQAYFLQHSPPDTRLAGATNGRQHVIDRGDTLGAIAKRYAIDVKALRLANGIDGDRIRVGDVLRIPEG